MRPGPLRALEAAKGSWSSLADLDVLLKVRQWAGIKDNQLSSHFHIALLAGPPTIASPEVTISSLSTLPSTPTSTILSLDTDMASPAHCPQVH